MNVSKKHFRKILAIVLCGTLLCGAASALAYSAGTKNPASLTTPTTDASDHTKGENPLTKDETVYIIADADGTAEKIIVSDWIKNTLGSETVRDQSELTNVANVKGEQSYVMNGEHLRVWDAQGNDLYYQGDIEKELPVNIAISYQLDGKSITAAELAGKSGRVTIRFDYRNNQSELVEIDGQEERIYVPFAMLTGLILDNSHFTNVAVSNGKLINDGNRTIVAGLAFPGLAGNLALDQEKLAIPGYIEISADAADFELMTTVTLATNELFRELDLSDVHSLDDLTASMAGLEGGMGQLLDGSSVLYGGLTTLLNRSGDLISGIDQLLFGAKELCEGAATLDGGASVLQSGADELFSGLGQLCAQNDNLTGGAKQVFETLLATADAQLAAAGLTCDKLTIDNYDRVLDGILAAMNEDTVYQLACNQARSTVESAVRANEPVIRSNVAAAVRSGALVQILASQGITNMDGSPMDAGQYETALQGGMIGDEVQSAVADALDAYLASAEGTAAVDQETERQIQSLISDKMSSAEVQNQISAALESAKNGASQISTLKSQLDGYHTFYQGLLAYTGGVADASAGAGELKTGADSMKEGTGALHSGANTLYNGLFQLKEGGGALQGGVGELQGGAMQLCTGLQAYNDQGIAKLVEAVNGDVGGLIARFRATCDVAKDYRSFSGISDEMDGRVKFIYRTDAIERE